MARIRTIKPEFWQDEKLAPLDAVTRLVFLGLISQADDAGRLVDSPRLIDGLLFPFTDDDSSTPLRKLADVGVIRRGRTASGQAIIQIVNWHHQKIDKPNLSGALPPIAKENPSVPDDSTNDRRSVGETSETHILDLGSTTNDQLPKKDASASSSGSGEPNADASDLSEAKQVREVFDYWREVSGHERATLTPERRKKIRSRLKTFSVAELKQAIDGACANPFFTGDNEQGQRYDWPETIFKNEAATEKHIHYTPTGSTPNGNHGHPVIEMSDEQYLAWSQPR